jgi:hypothetical protein
MRFVRRFAVVALVLPVVVASCDGSTEVLQPGQATAASVAQQTVAVGQPVPAPPAVRVTTTSGRPVPDVSVTFSVSADGGSLTGATAETNADGVAAVGSWVMGATVGVHTVTASVSGLAGNGVTFIATATAGPPAALTLLAGGPSFGVRGSPLQPHPVVQLVDEYGNAAAVANVLVTAATPAAGAQLASAQAATDVMGRAAFTALAIDAAAGEYPLTFSAPGLASVSLPAPLLLYAESPGACAPLRPLSLALGETARATIGDAANLGCLEFDLARNAGQQFLVLLENMPRTGSYRGAIFPGMASDSQFAWSLSSAPRGTAAAGMAATLPVASALPANAPARATHAWDFGAGPIYEIEPVAPPSMRGPQLRTDRGLVDMSSAAEAPAVGDTIEAWMEGIDRLGIPAGYQKAVIRLVTDLLVIAEDVRLATTLRRSGGGFNTPLHADTMAAIAQQYAQYARVQGDLLFGGIQNAATAGRNGRIVAIHSLMPNDSTWGYTYSSFDYFVWDYWVGTNGSTAGLNQRVQRNADNLFMHEIAHMRHVGVLQQANVAISLRGNRWLVEGFARFSERLPIAMRLLGSAQPSRTANAVLPFNPDFGNAYFRDDVPTFLNASTSMFGGYQHSSFVFDYFADQVALGGGDWRAALREFLVAAGSRNALDAVVNRWVGGTFEELFTRARIALYLDDNGTPGLPAWTQYHQFQLRASRPAGSQESSDPRNAWPALLPGTVQQASGALQPGAAWGFLIDGTRATSNAVYSVTGAAAPNAVISVTRVR